MPVFRFGPFRLDTEAYRLSRETAVVAASPKLLDLLGHLASRPSKLVTREELFSALWPDVIVSDNALTQLVSELRQLLGDPPAKPRYVQTVARRGYRFIADVEGVASSGRADEGRAAAKRAIALEPQYWAHYFRLGNASWGEERLDALRRALDLYPAFPFAHLLKNS